MQCRYVVSIIIALSLNSACASQIANSGWGMVSQLHPNGIMLLNYRDGEAKWKIIKEDNIKADFEIVSKNLGQPARYVETKIGSTLTFPNGDTIKYIDLKTNQSSPK